MTTSRNDRFRLFSLTAHKLLDFAWEPSFRRRMLALSTEGTLGELSGLCPRQRHCTPCTATSRIRSRSAKYHLGDRYYCGIPSGVLRNAPHRLCFRSEHFPRQKLGNLQRSTIEASIFALHADFGRAVIMDGTQNKAMLHE
jgi:hypothetical protein